MELDVLSFLAGSLVSGLALGSGILIGLMVNRDAFTRQVKDEEYDPTVEVMDDEFFDMATRDPDDGGHKYRVTDDNFPSDDILDELDRLHRHSTLTEVDNE